MLYMHHGIYKMQDDREMEYNLIKYVFAVVNVWGNIRHVHVHHGTTMVGTHM